MSDESLRLLERAVAIGDESRAKLAHAYVRAGRGWHGRPLISNPRGNMAAEGELDVYRWLVAPLTRQTLELIYVPGGEVPCIYHDHTSCAPCQGTGRVKIAPMYLGRFPVTNAEWLAFRAEFRNVTEETRHHPVTSVTHADALAYCSWAGLRLPTAQEWRWAALGHPVECLDAIGEGRGCANDHEPNGRDSCLHLPLFPWGDQRPSSERCAAADPRYQGKSTAPVVVREGLCDVCAKGKSRSCLHRSESIEDRRLVPARPAGASWCGAHDLCGNVWQLVTDSAGRVNSMGGSFRTNPLAGANGWSSERDGPWYDVGFRVALSAGEDS